MKKPRGFKDIPGYEGLYAVSKDGKVYSYPKKFRDNHKNIQPGRLMKFQKNQKGYYCITLASKNHTRSKGYISRLVAKTWIPNPNKLPYVDHINHDIHNNTIKNLRWCTHNENSYGQKKSINKSSKYKGVDLSHGKYQCRITHDKKSIRIGYFEKEIDAAKAYNKKAKELFCKFAWLNDIS